MSEKRQAECMTIHAEHPSVDTCTEERAEMLAALAEKDAEIERLREERRVGTRNAIDEIERESDKAYERGRREAFEEVERAIRHAQVPFGHNASEVLVGVKMAIGAVRALATADTEGGDNGDR